MGKENKLVIFQDKEIRRIWHNDEWYFSVVDVVQVLSESSDGRNYWKVLKHRLLKEGSEVVTKCNQLKLPSSDGKSYLTDCMNTEHLLRIIQSIPSKKAEPFKRWLAKVGYERIQEIENPELAQDRAREYYKMKGYPEHWIDTRLRGITVRQGLTDEWKERGVKEGKEYAILTNELSKATFGISINEHKKVKKLDPKFKNQNLRDHMSELESIFNMLGEQVTTELTKDEDVQGFDENKDAAQHGGGVAGRARVDTEKTLGRPVITEESYLHLGTEQIEDTPKNKKAKN